MNWIPTGALALLWLAGCSPALNWRNVPVPDAALTITLPCKPDQAQRTIELAGSPGVLSMAGCEADGAVLAVSHAALADPALAGAALTHWRAAVLANLGSGAAATAADMPYPEVESSKGKVRLDPQGYGVLRASHWIPPWLFPLPFVHQLPGLAGLLLVFHT